MRVADVIAYLNHDIDDAIRGNVITEEDLPKAYRGITSVILSPTGSIQWSMALFQKP